MLNRIPGYMLNKILGKEIARYVSKHRFLMICAILPACVAAFMIAAQAEMLPSLIDNGMSADTGPAPLTIKLPVWNSDPDSAFPVKIIEKEIIEEESSNSLLVLLSIYLVATVMFKSIATYMSDLAAAAFSNRAIRSLRIDLYNKYISLDQGFYHKHKIGSLISRSTADLTLMQVSISNIIIGFVQHPLTALFLFIVALKNNYKLTLIVLVTVPAILWLIKLFGRKVKKHSIRVQDATADVTSAYQETLLCLKVVQGFCTSEIHTEKFSKLADFLYKKTMHWNRWLRGMGPMMDTVVFTVGPAVLIAGKIYFNHSLGDLIGLFFALSRMYSPVKSLAKINADLKTLQGATERVFGIMNTKPVIVEKEDAYILPSHKKTIEFKDVAFSYKKESPILKEINFKVRAGEMIAFVGSTGAGKSTLMDLLPRFYDVTQGSIMIDGLDIRDVTVESLRKQIGIVSQEVLLFHDTILNNIACTSNDIDMDSVIKAATAAHAHGFIMEQSMQYETVVGDRGSLLSGGQKQRISIARAILTNPSILILDEVASALDAESEELIQKSIESLKGKCTIFAVAHRLSTIRNADRIFVLEKGRIVESGTHAELIKKSGRFKQLYDMQFQA